jgi:hypothetical protein
MGSSKQYNDNLLKLTKPKNIMKPLATLLATTLATLSLASCSAPPLRHIVKTHSKIYVGTRAHCIGEEGNKTCLVDVFDDRILDVKVTEMGEILKYAPVFEQYLTTFGSLRKTENSEPYSEKGYAIDQAHYLEFLGPNHNDDVF